MDPYVYWKITVSDIIQIIGLIVTIWIAIIVQKNLTKNRYLKEYFINELRSVREEYRLLFSEMYNSRLSSKDIKDRLKIISMRIRSIDTYIDRYFSTRPSKLKDIHSDFQQYITGEDEFNSQFKAKVISFSDRVKTQILGHQGVIVDGLTQRIVDVNNATKKFRWWFVRNKT